ncbi:MAG: SAF domain-containing protein [Propionibacteriaceae bacterium]|nr:SAF domain-containing protein [Propionibacteriaceae bacterium]
MKPHRLTQLARFLTVYRRLAAAGAAALCVFALAVIASGRAETRVAVVTVTARAEAGHMVAAADLTTMEIPAESVPDGALTAASEAVGRMLAATVPRGGILTADSLVAESGRTTSPGHLILPVYLAQTDILKLIRPGDRIALLITDGTTGETSIAEDVLVVAIPETADGGFLGGSSAEYVLVDVPQETAAVLAGSSRTVSVTIALA